MRFNRMWVWIQSVRAGVLVDCRPMPPCSILAVDPFMAARLPGGSLFLEILVIRTELEDTFVVLSGL